MRLVPRRQGGMPRHLLFVTENNAESKLLDEFFGKRVIEDGLIAEVTGQLRLSDECGEHYISIKANEAQQ